MKKGHLNPALLNWLLLELILQLNLLTGGEFQRVQIPLA